MLPSLLAIYHANYLAKIILFQILAQGFMETINYHL